MRVFKRCLLLLSHKTLFFLTCFKYSKIVKCSKLLISFCYVTMQLYLQHYREGERSNAFKNQTKFNKKWNHPGRSWVLISEIEIGAWNRRRLIVSFVSTKKKKKKKVPAENKTRSHSVFAINSKVTLRQQVAFL